jgi:hypothetical protein
LSPAAVTLLLIFLLLKGLLFVCVVPSVVSSTGGTGITTTHTTSHSLHLLGLHGLLHLLHHHRVHHSRVHSHSWVLSSLRALAAASSALLLGSLHLLHHHRIHHSWVHSGTSSGTHGHLLLHHCHVLLHALPILGHDLRRHATWRHLVVLGLGLVAIVVVLLLWLSESVAGATTTVILLLSHISAWLCFLNFNWLAQDLKGDVDASINSSLRVKGHETEPAGPTRIFVHHEGSIDNTAKLHEVLLKVLLAGFL